MQKAKRIRTRRVLDVVANDGGHDDDGAGDGDDGVADSLAPVQHPPPCTVSLWGRGSDFALLFLVRDKTLFSFVFFCFILFSLSSLVFAFAFVMAYVMKRVAHIETTLSHKTLVSGRVSRSEFIDFLHAPCGNVWQTRNVATATNFYSLFTFCYSLFVLALVLHIRIE